MEGVKANRIRFMLINLSLMIWVRSLLAGQPEPSIESERDWVSNRSR